MKVIKREKRNSLWIFRMISFALTTLICLGVFAFFREAPFGDKTLAASDAFIQYMDLMAFFKDVLSGNQSLTYTMTKGLGGSAIGIFSYYLASPTELLQLFFQKTKCLFHIIWQLSLNGNGIIDDDMVLAGPIQ